MPVTLSFEHLCDLLSVSANIDKSGLNVYLRNYMLANGSPNSLEGLKLLIKKYIDSQKFAINNNPEPARPKTDLEKDNDAIKELEESIKKTSESRLGFNRLSIDLLNNACYFLSYLWFLNSLVSFFNLSAYRYYWIGYIIASFFGIFLISFYRLLPWFRNVAADVSSSLKITTGYVNVYKKRMTLRFKKKVWDIKDRILAIINNVFVIIKSLFATMYEVLLIFYSIFSGPIMIIARILKGIYRIVSGIVNGVYRIASGFVNGIIFITNMIIRVFKAIKNIKSSLIPAMRSILNSIKTIVIVALPEISSISLAILYVARWKSYPYSSVLFGLLITLLTYRTLSLLAGKQITNLVSKISRAIVLIISFSALTLVFYIRKQKNMTLISSLTPGFLMFLAVLHYNFMIRRVIYKN